MTIRLNRIQYILGKPVRKGLNDGYIGRMAGVSASIPS